MSLGSLSEDYGVYLKNQGNQSQKDQQNLQLINTLTVGANHQPTSETILEEQYSCILWSESL